MMNFDPFRPAPEPRKKKQSQTVESQQLETVDQDDFEHDPQKLMDALWIDIGGEG